MRFTINGADKNSGEDVTLTLDANSENEAIDKAGRMGIMVSSALPDVLAYAQKSEPPALLIEHTAKKWKLKQIIGAMMIGLGGVIAAFGTMSEIQSMFVLGVIVAALGVPIGLYGWVGAFWYHE